MKRNIFSIVLLLALWHNQNNSVPGDFHERFKDEVERTGCRDLKDLYNKNFNNLNEQDLEVLKTKINDCLTLPNYHRDRDLEYLRDRVLNRRDALQASRPAPAPASVAPSYHAQFKHKVDAAGCQNLEDLFHIERIFVETEEELNYLVQKLNMCLSNQNNPKLNRLRDSVFDRIEALRYRRARQAATTWFIWHNEFSR